MTFPNQKYGSPNDYIDAYFENHSKAVSSVNKKNVAEAVAIMERSGALAACHEQANDFLQGVRATLAKYPQGEPRQLFEALLEYMVTRGH